MTYRNLVIVLATNLSLFNVSAQANIQAKIQEAKKYSDSGVYDSTIYILYSVLQDSLDNANGEIYMLLAQSHSYQGSYVTGLEYYKKANSLAVNNRDNKLYGKSLLGIGAVYYAMDSIDYALENYEKAIPILLEDNDTSSIANLYSNTGLLYSEIGDCKKANSNFKKALNLFQLNSDIHGIISTNYNMANNFYACGELSDAIKNYKLSLELSLQRGSTEDVAKNLRKLGKAYFETRRYENSALNYFKYDTISHNLYHTNSRNNELEYLYKGAVYERDSAQKQARIVILTFSLGITILITLGIYFILNQRRRRIKLASEKAIQDLLQNQEMKTTYALLEGQDKERKRIAAELHDNLGSILVTLNMYADTLQNKKPKDIPALAQKIADVAQLANTETRKISHSLDSGMLRHFGLEAAIKQLTEAVSSARKIKFNLSLQTGEISSDASIEIYRIIQELVNNTLKHAQCTKVHLELTHVDHSFSIIYEDNGVGFNPIEESGGMGLKNIQNRAAKLDGELTIDSTPGKGSSFIIEIPHL
jgi:signal transduction histidine kinase/predicted negative regulator of RcsB-dependent stress response